MTGIDPMYDAPYISSYYDACGEKEWDRFDAPISSRVNLLIRTHFLQKSIHAGDEVLDAGGPGRFTIERTRCGARVTVGDISPVQLALNEKPVREAGFETAMVARYLLDIVDATSYPSDEA